MKSPFINWRALALAILLVIMSLFSLMTYRDANAQGQALPKPSGHVNDFAELVDKETRQRVETVLANLQQRTGLEFVIATVKTAGEEDLYN